ncbi:hypothetical protein M8C21_007474 [Ambrosia artemisiifolia]|uniref:Uncharacterized protein n=1 Tax=Ambrosia artemisiifolia TaxID=4212 RepID=A0AAD5C3D7_AMBAR|nr:hypothetical protein M8C21_007474 [Ambrosia artemisiifolia]
MNDATQTKLLFLKPSLYPLTTHNTQFNNSISYRSLPLPLYSRSLPLPYVTVVNGALEYLAKDLVQDGLLVLFLLVRLLVPSQEGLLLTNLEERPFLSYINGHWGGITP